MYGGTSPRAFGGLPLAMIGVLPFTGASVLWIAVIALLPVIAVLGLGRLLLRQDLTEAESLVVELGHKDAISEDDEGPAYGTVAWVAEAIQ